MGVKDFPELGPARAVEISVGGKAIRRGVSHEKRVMCIVVGKKRLTAEKEQALDTRCVLIELLQMLLEAGAIDRVGLSQALGYYAQDGRGYREPGLAQPGLSLAGFPRINFLQPGAAFSEPCESKVPRRLSGFAGGGLAGDSPGAGL